MLKALKTLPKGDIIVKNLKIIGGTKDESKINRESGKYTLYSSNNQ